MAQTLPRSLRIDNCNYTPYNIGVRFAHRRLQRFYDNDDPRGLNPSHVERIRQILTILTHADKPADIDRPGFRLHPLKGAMRGLWSVRVSGNWRIIFRFDDSEVVDVDLVDYH